LLPPPFSYLEHDFYLLDESPDPFILNEEEKIMMKYNHLMFITRHLARQWWGQIPV